MREDALLNKFPELLSIPKEKRIQLYRHFRSAPEWVLDFCSFETIPKNTFFIREGEKVHTIYFVVDGIFQAIDYRVLGVAYVYAKFSKVYSMGGLEIFMDFKTYGTSLKTVDLCKVIKISKEAFEKWMQEDIQGLRYETKMMGEYLLTQGKMAREYLFLSGPERLAKILIEKYERKAEKGVLIVKSTLQELSDETGFATKTVSRAIKSLREEGLIDKEGKNFIVREEQYHRLKDLVQSIVAPDLGEMKE